MKQLFIKFLLDFIISKFVAPNLTTEMEVHSLQLIVSFLVSVVANIVSYYICKWLDENNSEN